MIRPLFLFSVIFVAMAQAQFGIPTQLPKQTNEAEVRNKVGQYCRLDYLGARLNEQDFQKLKPVVNWPTNPDFPLIDVVSRYDLGSNVTQEHGKWHVTVTYHLLGRFNLGQGYSTEVSGSTTEVEFTVQEFNGRVKGRRPGSRLPSPLARRHAEVAGGQASRGYRSPNQNHLRARYKGPVGPVRLPIRQVNHQDLRQCCAI